MRSKQIEIFIRVLPCGYSHINLTNKGVAEIQRRRVLVATERPFAPQAALKSEMNVPLLEPATHVLT
jgi:hypothetical protein